MIKKIFIIFTLILIIFNMSRVQAVQMTDDGSVEEYGCKVNIVQVTAFDVDDIDPNYYSATFEIIPENCTLVKYRIPSWFMFPEQMIITNTYSNSHQTNFEGDQNKFKVIVPVEKVETEFLGGVEVLCTFRVIIDYITTDGSTETKIIEDAVDQVVYLDNRKSTLEIEIIDSETLEGINGVKVLVEDRDFYSYDEYISNESGKVFINKIGAGRTEIELLDIPKEYTAEKIEYILAISYKENAKCTIELNRKKGKLSILGLSNSFFEIYDENNKLIDSFETDEEGKIDVDINIGTYLLKQIEVPEGYEKTENIMFSIKENEVCELSIINKASTPSEETQEQNEDQVENLNLNEEKPNNIEENEVIKEQNTEAKETKEENKEQIENSNADEEKSNNIEENKAINEQNAEVKEIQEENKAQIENSNVDEEKLNNIEETKVIKEENIEEKGKDKEKIETKKNEENEKTDVTKSIVSDIENEVTQVADVLQAEEPKEEANVQRLVLITEDAWKEDINTKLNEENISNEELEEQEDINEYYEKYFDIKDEIEKMEKQNSQNQEILSEENNNSFKINSKLLALIILIILISILFIKKKKQTAKQPASSKNL